jgi:hypothetical protein
MHFQIMMKEKPTKYIFKVNHIFRISILLLHVSALQERHLQGAQMILMKLCVCYVISAVAIVPVDSDVDVVRYVPFGSALLVKAYRSIIFQQFQSGILIGVSSFLFL